MPRIAGGGMTPFGLFMDICAAFASDHMARYGTTQRVLAVVSAKKHRHAGPDGRHRSR